MFGFIWKTPDKSTDRTKLRCKKCGAINEKRKWINQPWWQAACPKCGVSMRSLVWTGSKPNFELARRTTPRQRKR